jgi:hypothetical protein
VCSAAVEDGYNETTVKGRFLMGQDTVGSHNGNHSEHIAQQSTGATQNQALHPALNQSICNAPAGNTTIMLAAPQHRGGSPMQAASTSEGSSTAQKISMVIQKLGLDEQQLKAAARAVILACMHFSDKLSEKLNEKKKDPNERPSWNEALAQKSRKLRQGDKRAFLMIFLVFFGAFCWLYLLYALHHKDAVKAHTALVDLSQKNSSNSNGNRLFSATTQSPQPEPGATQAYTPAQAGAYNPAAFGSPRTDIAYPTQPSYATGFNQTVGQAANQSVQAQYAQAYASAGAPYGVTSPYTSASPAVPVQAMVPANFNPNSSIVGPRSLRHAVGVPTGFGAAPAGRLRMVVNR